MDIDEISALVNIGSDMTYSFSPAYHGRQFVTMTCDRTDLEITINHVKGEIRKQGLMVKYNKATQGDEAIARIIVKKFLSEIKVAA